MKLNHDFYTFSPKHFKGLYKILNDYPSEAVDDWEKPYEIVKFLAEKGKVSLKIIRTRVKGGYTKTTEFIKFWPHPKYIEYFRRFDKRKLV